MEPVIQDTKFNKQLFGNNFIWGVSTAAFQIEGSCAVDGKSQSIWDIFSHKKGKILNEDNADIACDFYNKFKEDIDIIHQLNISNFRFSISWPRILPNGTGEINQEGVLFYNRVINYCIAKGIEPWVTIYHWDLPHVLEDQGGWTNRDVISWFECFVTACADSFGDRVKNWIVMNEPAVFTGAGYFFGIHAPGLSGINHYLRAVHNSVLSMGAGGRILRAKVPGARIGTTFSCSHVEPYSDKTRDVKAAKRVDAFINRLYIEPILGLGYPVNEVSVLKGIKKLMLPGDEDKLKFDFDFIGLQNYTREIVKCSYITAMGWENYPPAIYHIIQKYNSYPQIKEIIITENGSAFPDTLTNGIVNDIERLKFLRENLQQVLKAKNDGCKVAGYFVWTLTDNFEWAEGYHARFGLVHIDFNTQKRTIKSSGQWYADFLK